MKRIKSGFTLAEVLITLGVIGVIAAIVMPSVMTNYTYKTVGVKLSKFAAQLENATTAYVAQNDVFVSENSVVADFVDNSFIYKNVNDLYETVNCSENTADAPVTNCPTGVTDADYKYWNIVSTSYPVKAATSSVGKRLGAENSRPVIDLKDGTQIQPFTLPSYSEQDYIEVDRVGEVMFGIAYNPNVQGLPQATQQAYGFVVTERGYVYPYSLDACMEEIYSNNYQTKASTFKKDGNCTALKSGS